MEIRNETLCAAPDPGGHGQQAPTVGLSVGIIKGLLALRTSVHWEGTEGLCSAGHQVVLAITLRKLSAII